MNANKKVGFAKMVSGKLGLSAQGLKKKQIPEPELLDRASISSFISPCKSWTNACFGITQFVTPNTHVPRHPGFFGRKKKKMFW